MVAREANEEGQAEGVLAQLCACGEFTQLTLLLLGLLLTRSLTWYLEQQVRAMEGAHALRLGDGAPAVQIEGSGHAWRLPRLWDPEEEKESGEWSGRGGAGGGPRRSEEQRLLAVEELRGLEEAALDEETIKVVRAHLHGMRAQERAALHGAARVRRVVQWTTMPDSVPGRLTDAVRPIEVSADEDV